MDLRFIFWVKGRWKVDSILMFQDWLVVSNHFEKAASMFLKKNASNPKNVFSKVIYKHK